MAKGAGGSGSRPALKSDHARAGHFLDPERSDQIQKSPDLVVVSGDFEHHRLDTHINYLCPENVANLHDLGPGFGICGNFEENQLPGHCCPFRKMVDLDNIDQLVQLLERLVQSLVVPDDGRGDARKPLEVNGAYIQGLNIETPSAEHPSDPGEDPKFILHKDGDRVLLVCCHGIEEKPWTLPPLEKCVKTRDTPMKNRPNFILIQGEDSGRQLGCYGVPDARTPNLDRLAAEGCRYDNAFATAGVCAPSRGCMATGRYQWSLGNHHMRCRLVDPPRTFTEELREAGYYVNWADKTDFNFAPRPEFADEHETGNHAAWRDRLASGEFNDRPFLLYTNLFVTHESTMWSPGEPHGAARIRLEERHRLRADQRPDPARVHVPAYLPDDYEVRHEIARFYEALAVQDLQAGEMLEALEASGQRDNTYVIYLTDHGRGLPREKRWPYGAGIHNSLLIRGPGIAPGTVIDNLVSWVDIAPTILSLAGLSVPGEYEGQIFLGPDQAPPREAVFAGRDRMDCVYDRVRCVRDHRWHYLRNYFPQLPRAQALPYGERRATMQVLRQENALGRLPPEQAGFMSPTRPSEELYDTESDPEMVRNLAEEPAHADTLARLRSALDRQLAETGDLAERPERELIDDGILLDDLTERYRDEAENRAELPEKYALGGLRKPIVEMPL